jgi:hypothetical protein
VRLGIPYPAAITVGGGIVGLAGRADAAQTTLPLTCDGQQLTVRVNSSNSGPNGGWSVGQIVDGGTGHGIPTKISGTIVDNKDSDNPQTLFTFEQVKGRGNANHNQPTIMCTTSQSGALGELIDPGTPLPPGISLDDPATFTITVTVVRQP